MINTIPKLNPCSTSYKETIKNTFLTKLIKIYVKHQKIRVIVKVNYTLLQNGNNL